MRRLATFFAGWRGLGRFWALVLLLVLLGGVTLQWLGPPPPKLVPIAAVNTAKSLPAPPSHAAATQTAPQRPGRGTPGEDAPGPVAEPAAALLEPIPGSTTDSLPRIAADGRTSMHLYAAAFDTGSKAPRVGIMLAGMGLGLADSKNAIAKLPPGVSFAISPYAADPAPVLAAARLSGHEYLISIPMEPQGFPMNDPGPKALMTNLEMDENLRRLRWVLSRIGGYVGATAVLGDSRGERFVDVPEQLNPVLDQLDQRGLLYVDPRPGQGPLPGAWSRSVDLMIDEPTTAAGIDASLAKLETIAHERGSALGAATAPRPVTVERLASWATGLASRGLVLAPVSALVRPPAGVGPAGDKPAGDKPGGDKPGGEKPGGEKEVHR